MKRLIVVTSATALAALALATGVAEAGPPTNQGCYGEGISVLAANQASPGGFGRPRRLRAGPEHSSRTRRRRPSSPGWSGARRRRAEHM